MGNVMEMVKQMGKMEGMGDMMKIISELVNKHKHNKIFVDLALIMTILGGEAVRIKREKNYNLN